MSSKNKPLSQQRISNLEKQFYKAAPLDAYPKQKQWFVRFAALLSYLLVYLIGLTMRWQMFRGNDRRGGVAKDQPLIYVFWHNRILPATWYFRRLGIVVMTSQSYDGEIIARMIQFFGYGASRGSTTKGGSKSLREMASCLQAGFDVAFTIDGPKGPIYEAKGGAVQLAKLTGCPILPVCQTPMKYWELKSWDRFRIPKFFSKGLIAYTPPIYVSRDSSQEEVANKQAQLQSALEWLHQESEEWINSKGKINEKTFSGY